MDDRFSVLAMAFVAESLCFVAIRSEFVARSNGKSKDLDRQLFLINDCNSQDHNVQWKSYHQIYLGKSNRKPYLAYLLVKM